MDIAIAVNGEELIEKYKRKLKVENLEMCLKLSPGVRLKAIMEQEPDTNQDKGKPIGVKRRKNQNILPKLSEAKSKIQREHSKSGEKWNTIYEMFEMKRQDYKDQWKDHVIAKAQESRDRLDQYQKIERRDIPPWGSSKSKIVQKKKIEISVPTKDDRIYNQKREMRTQNIERTDPRLVLEKPKCVPKKKTVVKPVVEYDYNTAPVLQKLSIDLPLAEDARNLWNSEDKTAKKANFRVHQLISMCDSTIKFKQISQDYARNHINKKYDCVADVEILKEQEVINHDGEDLNENFKIITEFSDIYKNSLSKRDSIYNNRTSISRDSIKSDRNVVFAPDIFVDDEENGFFPVINVAEEVKPAKTPRYMEETKAEKILRELNERSKIVEETEEQELLAEQEAELQRQEELQREAQLFNDIDFELTNNQIDFYATNAEMATLIAQKTRDISVLSPKEKIPAERILNIGPKREKVDVTKLEPLSFKSLFKQKELKFINVNPVKPRYWILKPK